MNSVGVEDKCGVGDVVLSGGLSRYFNREYLFPDGGQCGRENSNETILMILKHGECELTLSVYHGCGLFYHLAKKRLNIIHLPVALAKFMMVDAW